LFSTNYTPLSSTAFNGNDRLFNIGNGTSNIVRSDALTILKNGNTGIGTATPSEKLEVVGKIQAVDVNFSGLPIAIDEAAAITAGLAAGDLYQTPTGEIRIKL
jgi:hypothetical protein